MLKTLAKTLPVLLLISSSTTFGQQIQKKILKNGSEATMLTTDTRVVCESGVEDMDIVPMPNALRNRINARVKTSEFIIDYNGFTPEAREAFQYAVDIWASIFTSPVPIRVNATFTLLEAPAIGAAKFTNAFRNFPLAPRANTWYQMPLAEKIAGEELNDTTEFDIDIEFNNDFSWYYDTANPDSIVGTGLTDFATVVLHELGHALGFSSFGASVTESPPNSGTFVGDINLDDIHPIVYNSFLYTPTGENVVDDVPNGGSIMANVLTTSGLRFTGHTSSVRVHAPDPYNPGSSISHTDNLIGELMNPSLGPNGYIHDPGRALNMMHDMGWEFTYLHHDPLPSTENFDQTFDVIADVYSDLGYDTATLQLHYSTDEFASDTVKLDMTAMGTGNEFIATIPNPGEGVVFSYYLTATDNKGRVFTNPGEAPEARFYQFIAAVDDVAPEISHTPIDFLLPAASELKISASIEDYFTGVDTAYVEWFINDTQQATVGMEQNPEFPAGWEVTLDFTSEFSIGDIVKYQIFASDNAGSPTTGTAPGETEFYSIPIEGSPDPVSTYVNDFNSPSTDFLGESFTISTPIGFADGALHSPHPYEAAGEGNEINYISQLKIPIIVDDENTTISFDEIVLVEPGEPNAFFGSEDFWDYVVVEATKDDGANWIPVAPGYDCQADNAWRQRYNGGILDGQNSSALGEPGLYRERTIDLLENGSFIANDTVLIRFRLYSDPFAYGWGWAIDNLSIQEEETVTAISDFLQNENDFRIYPNPSIDGNFNIEATFSKPVPHIEIRVMDAMGRVVDYDTVNSSGRKLSYQLNINNQPPGVYVVQSTIGDARLTRKVIKSN